MNNQEKRMKELKEKFPKLDLQNQQYIMGIVRAFNFAESKKNKDEHPKQTA